MNRRQRNEETLRVPAEFAPGSFPDRGSTLDPMQLRRVVIDAPTPDHVRLGGVQVSA
jgi:hypothetical protein